MDSHEKSSRAARTTAMRGRVLLDGRAAQTGCADGENLSMGSCPRKSGLRGAANNEHRAWRVREHGFGSAAHQQPSHRAGLPGADWWVCGPVTPEPADARVDLAEVAELYRVHGLWGSLT